MHFEQILAEIENSAEFRVFRVFGFRRRTGRKHGIHGIPRKISDFGVDFYKTLKMLKIDFEQILAKKRNFRGIPWIPRFRF